MSAKKDTTESKLKLTPSVEEGPYYKPGSPERSIIDETGTPGTKLVVEGHVMDKAGKPIAGAWMDFWQADGKGNYDNNGFNLRGHQYTDANGHYRLETVRPHEYLFRAAHVHAKVRANENAPVLTVQLFFPDEQKNATDPIFQPGTVMNVARMRDRQHATFDFVVEK